jgi:hypothetical protein
MTQPDESQELAQHYAEMSDGELQLISSQQADLTDAARSALGTELTRRGIAQASEGESGPSRGHDEVEFQDLVTLRRFRDLPEALIAKGSLESAGIDCYLVDDNMVRIFVPTFTGGARLQIKPDDLAEATEILNEPVPQNFAPETGQPRCPRCYSLNISSNDVTERVQYTSGYTNLPVSFHSTAWTCKACGYHWEDEP